jgi:hypothetical protein
MQNGYLIGRALKKKKKKKVKSSSNFSRESFNFLLFLLPIFSFSPNFFPIKSKKNNILIE